MIAPRFESWPLVGRALLVACPVVAVVLLIELGVRWAGFGFPPEGPAPNVNAYFIVTDPVLGFRNRPVGDFVAAWVAGAPRVRTDELGFRRGLGWPGSGDEPLVVLVGDSTTFCAEVGDAETSASEIYQRLAARGRRYRVLNAGVRGYGSVQSRRMLKECLERFGPAALAVYTYCPNDYVENLNPIVYWPLKAPIAWWDAATDRVRDLEVTSPAIPWGESFVVPLHGSPWAERRPWTERLAIASRSAFLYHSRRVLLQLLERRSEGEPIRLPGGSLGPLVQDGRDWDEQIQWAVQNGADRVLAEQIRAMAGIAEKAGASFLVTRFTHGRDQLHEQRLAGLCASVGVEFAGMASAFPDRPEQTMARLTDGTYDPHYGTEGTRLYADALLPALERRLDAWERKRGRALPR
jgi:hypothetical protein